MDEPMQIYVTFPAAGEVQLARAPLPEVGPEEVLLETLISGLSAGTEGMWFAGTATAVRTGRKTYPYRPGYELVGRVARAGEKVAGVTPGDRVFALKPHGTHALLGPRDIWMKLPPEVASEDALALGVGGTCVHAIHRAGVAYGDAVAVVGLGTLGLVMAQLLRPIASVLLAATASPAKRGWAEALGAEVLAGDALPPVGWPRPHAVFECSGTNAGIARAVELLAPQGRLVAAGFYTEPLRLDGEALFAKELSVLGIRARGPAATSEQVRFDARRNTELAFARLRDGTLRLTPWVTHRIRPSELIGVYRMVAEKSKPYVQIVVDWTSGI